LTKSALLLYCLAKQSPAQDFGEILNPEPGFFIDSFFDLTSFWMPK
jgi:hypothetical protein